MGTVYGKTRGFPLLLLRVCGRDGNPHGEAEQAVHILGDFPESDVVYGLRGENDELQGQQSAVDLIGGGSRVSKGLGDPLVDPIALKADCVTIAGRFDFMS